MEIRVGNRIRELRTTKGLSQADLARELDVSPVTVYRWEGGTREISLTMLGWVADVLEVELSEFFPKAQAPLFPPEEGQRCAQALAWEALGPAPGGGQLSEEDRRLVRSRAHEYIEDALRHLEHVLEDHFGENVAGELGVDEIIEVLADRTVAAVDK